MYRNEYEPLPIELELQLPYYAGTIARLSEPKLRSALTIVLDIAGTALALIGLVVFALVFLISLGLHDVFPHGLSLSFSVPRVKIPRMPTIPLGLLIGSAKRSYTDRTLFRAVTAII